MLAHYHHAVLVNAVLLHDIKDAWRWIDANPLYEGGGGMLVSQQTIHVNSVGER